MKPPSSYGIGVDAEHIECAVASVWREARLEPMRCAASSVIVPLSALLEPLPIVVRERDGLTYGRAGEFLTRVKGHAVAMPGADGQKLAGFLFFEPLYACILTCRSTQVEANVDGQVHQVQRQEFVSRRRFTIAHELAHYVLHARPLLSKIDKLDARSPVFAEGLRAIKDSDEDSSLKGDPRLAPGASELLGRSEAMLEAEADAFAASLLMPQETVQRAVEVLSAQLGAQRENLARRLSGEFLVSRAAMRRRLEELALGEALGEA